MNVANLRAGGYHQYCIGILLTEYSFIDCTVSGNVLRFNGSGTSHQNKYSIISSSSKVIAI